MNSGIDILNLNWNDYISDSEIGTKIWTIACKHLTEKLMRGGFGGGRTPQKLGLSDKTESNTPNFRRKFPLKNPKLVDLQK